MLIIIIDNANSTYVYLHDYGTYYHYYRTALTHTHTYAHNKVIHAVGINY